LLLVRSFLLNYFTKKSNECEKLFNNLNKIEDKAKLVLYDERINTNFKYQSNITLLPVLRK
jgi:hypothetical protein